MSKITLKPEIKKLFEPVPHITDRQRGERLKEYDERLAGYAD